MAQNASIPAVVLVVEDEPMQRMMVIDLVEEAGYAAIEANNADDAVRLLETRDDIRLVFTDVDMPGSLDGMRLAATVRDRWPPIELIIVSGQRRPRPDDLPARCLFFAKPFGRDEVVAAMHRFIGG